MLLAGFNGLFTKVASELSEMFTAFKQVHFGKHQLKFDFIRDAQELQVPCPKQYYSLHFLKTFFLFWFPVKLNNSLLYMC